MRAALFAADGRHGRGGASCRPGASRRAARGAAQGPQRCVVSRGRVWPGAVPFWLWLPCPGCRRAGSALLASPAPTAAPGRVPSLCSDDLVPAVVKRDANGSDQTPIGVEPRLRPVRPASRCRPCGGFPGHGDTSLARGGPRFCSGYPKLTPLLWLGAPVHCPPNARPQTRLKAGGKARDPLTAHLRPPASSGGAWRFYTRAKGGCPTHSAAADSPPPPTPPRRARARTRSTT